MKKTTQSNLPLDKQVDISASQPHGLTAKVILQEKARSLSSYNQSIESNDSGKDNEGNKIAVNTAGRWLFGVPGYAGHLRMAQVGDSISLFYPTDAPTPVHELVSALKEAVETKQ